MSDQPKSSPTPEELSARIEGRKGLTARQRGQLPKVFWKEQDPAARVGNIREVPFAYTGIEARAEAVRCLSCKNEPCVSGCPVSVDVPGFLRLVADGDFRGAIRLIKETNLLPAICGRVCPQESQCQENCMVAKVHKDLGFAVSVGKIATVVPPAIQIASSAMKKCAQFFDRMAMRAPGFWPLPPRTGSTARWEMPASLPT